MRLSSNARSTFGGAVLVLYEIAAWATFGRLMFFDGAIYNWWNWIILLPINGFLGQIWPLYWLIIRPFFGH